MPIPPNSIYIVQGEMNMVAMAMKRGNKWSSHAYQDNEDPLIRNFVDLKDILNHVSDLNDLEPNQFLGPFLEVIRSGDTTGPVTGLALSSINKFLSYGLVDATCETAASAVENITDAVTHARFVGTDPGSDEVVLMKILQVLRRLLLTPAGTHLSNESVCEIMQSCFRICFEMRLSELLRKSAEGALVDMAQLLFSRLPQFREDNGAGTGFRKLKMRAGTMDTPRSKSKKKSPRPKHKKYVHPAGVQTKSDEPNSCASLGLVSSPDSGLATPQDSGTPATTPACDVIREFPNEAAVSSAVSSGQSDEPNAEAVSLFSGGGVIDMQDNLQAAREKSVDLLATTSSNPDVSVDDQESSQPPSENDYVNPRGVRFTPQQHGRDGPLIPYGLPCVRELFRFLITLINPLDKMNSDVMIHIGLSLLTVALETNADDISNFPSLLNMVKDEMCRNLFSLISSEKMSLFAVDLRVCFLLFESLRSHLKFQVEMYLSKLMAIIMSESPKITYDQREMVLESIVQLWRIPGFVTELYLNYDCGLFCTNLFEELTKLLSKNAFPMSGLYSTHLLALDALLTVIDSIENHCHTKVLQERQALENAHKASENVAPPEPELTNESEASRSLNASHVLFPSGYLLAQSILSSSNSVSPSTAPPTVVRDRSSRLKPCDEFPSHSELVNVKHRKKILTAGTEQFNSKPSKGIQFLQENGMLNTPMEAAQVAEFLKENPHLDKKMIGEYISNRKNSKVLEAFVSSFNFDDTRIDEALRMYLETFRLPGEAPVIALVMEQFADHWHKSNGEPFVSSDAAFTLAYAVIMLNVDQHNHNVKKQSNPMTIEDFKKNLRNINGGQDFDSDMIEEIYTTIKSEEIIMPAERIGIVKDNYLWKVLLRRGNTKDGSFYHAPGSYFDRNLFALIWGPTVAALSFVFDKSMEDLIIQRTISGFRKCAMIAAHFGMSDVFDHLIISLCKFTTLLNSLEAPDSLPISFGANPKAQLAAKTVFNLAHRHGDILREGWKNVLDCLLQLYHAKLLPKALVQGEDFVEASGKISLIREEIPAQRSEVGIFSSFYSYITLTAADSQVQKGMNSEDQEFTQRAQACIIDCHPEQLVSESKFLRADSLQELVKVLMFASPSPDGHVSHSGTYDEDATVFFLELLVEIVVHNRDRVNVVWHGVRDHIYGLMMGASATEHLFLMERSVVSILRLAVRLLWREDMTAQVLQSLRMLLLLKHSALLRVARQIAFALHELLKTNAANIHAAQDWSTLFTLLEYVGTGAKPPKILDGGTAASTATASENTDSASENGVQSDSEVASDMGRTELSPSPDRGYTSDSELQEMQSDAKSQAKARQELLASQKTTGSWILVGKEGEIDTLKVLRIPVNQYDIVMKKDFSHHDPAAFLKSCESLAFLVRDVAHITPDNFESCVHCIRTFAEASLNGGRNAAGASDRRPSKSKDGRDKKPSHRLSATGRRKEDSASSGAAAAAKMKRSVSSAASVSGLTEEDDERTPDGGYHQASIQLLDLMHTLHTRASAVIMQWASEDSPSYSDNNSRPVSETGTLWTRCWCPILQGIARLCCDSRRPVRTKAVTYLQRALLVHDLQTLSAAEWEACFNKVLFPLLVKLLENISPSDPNGVEETRMRGATLICKVFLQHLGALLCLPTFTALWLTILDFMDKYMHADKSDLLCEAIPESLKNMLLVMDTAGIFSSSDGCSQLWTVTWDRIDAFLPGLKDEVFRSHTRVDQKMAEPEVDVSSPIPDASSAITAPISVTVSAADCAPSGTSPVSSVVINMDVVTGDTCEDMIRPSSPTVANNTMASSSLILQAAPPTPDIMPFSVLEPPPGMMESQPSMFRLHAQPPTATSIPLVVNREMNDNSDQI